MIDVDIGAGNSGKGHRGQGSRSWQRGLGLFWSIQEGSVDLNCSKSWNSTEQHSRTPQKNTRVLICHKGLRCIVMKLCKLFLFINPIFSSLLDISDHSCVHFSACYRKAWKKVTLILVKPAWENLRSKFMFQLDERKLPQFDCKTMTLTWHVQHLEAAYNIWSNLGNELWWESYFQKMLWNKSLPHGSLGIAFHSFVWNYSTACWGGWKANKLAGQQSHIMYTLIIVHKTCVIKLISRAFYRPLILLNRSALAAFTFKATFCSDFMPNAICINRNTHISIIKHSLFHLAFPLQLHYCGQQKERVSHGNCVDVPLHPYSFSSSYTPP